MAADLSALLTSSKTLTSHLSRPDLPPVNLSLEQIEALSRRLVSRQPGTSTDTDRANYLLAQAHVDAPALSNSIAHLNTSTTFTPLQALQDTDVAGYLRIAHEQNLISTIEEGRKETQDEFYRVLEERSHSDWEAKKKRAFDILGVRRIASADRSMSDMRTVSQGNLALGSTGQSLSLQMQNKMMVYDRVITELNNARLKDTSYPIVHSLAWAAKSLSSDPKSLLLQQNFLVLARITGEKSAFPSVEHAGAHVLNAQRYERQWARVYLGDQNTPEAADLRRQITRGAREALEEQYWDVLERTLHSRPLEAKVGGDPSHGNKVRAFLAVRFYRNGEWEDRIELVAGQPLWAKLFYLIRTGHLMQALDEAEKFQHAINSRESSFLTHFRTWVQSTDQKLPKASRDHLQAIYNTHMLRSSTVDPFKLALYKLMGRLDPLKRNVPQVTTTTEDWLWFQLAMIDEDENGGLRSLAEVLLGYGERHFDGVPNQPGARVGMWASVLLMSGQFERAVAALWEHQETEVEAVHLAIALAYHGLLRIPTRAETSDMTPLSLSPTSPPALSLSTLIWRYVRQFVKMDAKEAMQYIYCICLSADQPGPVGHEQDELAWELTQRIIVLANSGPAWEDLVGGFRPDGSKFNGAIELGATLLNLRTAAEYHEKILMKAAQYSQDNDRVAEAIKLYNLAEEYTTVISCLAQALGNTVSQPSPDEKARLIEKTAFEILRHYERMNRGIGKERDAVVRLLRIREAMEAKKAGKFEAALDILESTDLIPLTNDMSKITKRAEEFRDLHESLQRNLETYVMLSMDVLSAMSQKTKNSIIADATKQNALTDIRAKSRAVVSFAGMLKFRMANEVYAHLSRLGVAISL